MTITNLEKYITSTQPSPSVTWYWKNHTTGSVKEGTIYKGNTYTQDPSQTWTSSSKWTVTFDGYTLTAKRKDTGDGSFKCTIRVNGIEKVQTGASHNFTFNDLGKKVTEWKPV